jgi:hypothetical protein
LFVFYNNRKGDIAIGKIIAESILEADAKNLTEILTIKRNSDGLKNSGGFLQFGE